MRPVAKSSPSSVVSSDVSAEVSSLEDLDEEGEVIEKDVSFEELEESSFQEKEPKDTPTSSKKVKEWIHKFQLPSRFSASVEDGLKTGQLNSNLQNEFIRDICTAILNHTMYPTKAERVQIAKLIVSKYPCMKDKKILENSTTWGSLEVKIMNRMKKLQRPKRLAADCSGERKGAKPGKRAKHSLDSWSKKPPLPEGETLDTLKNYIERQLPSIGKKRDVKTQRDFLDHTYALRRIQILDNPLPIKEVLNSYPPLKQFVHLKGELCRIFEDDDIPQNIRSKYQKTWGPKIIKYAEMKRELNSYLDAMKAALAEDGVNHTEIKDQTVLVLINKLLKQKGKGPQQEVFTILPRTASVDAEIASFLQPQIVAIGDGFDFDKLYIVSEGMTICTIPHQSIVDSIVALLSSFYIFNMAYKDSKAILTFLEQALMGIGRGQTLLSVNTLFNDISDL